MELGKNCWELFLSSACAPLFLKSWHNLALAMPSLTLSTHLCPNVLGQLSSVSGLESAMDVNLRNSFVLATFTSHSQSLLAHGHEVHFRVDSHYLVTRFGETITSPLQLHGKRWYLKVRHLDDKQCGSHHWQISGPSSTGKFQTLLGENFWNLAALRCLIKYSSSSLALSSKHPAP